MTGSVDFDSPSCLLDLANDCANLPKGRTVCCKVEGIRSNSSDPESLTHPTVAGAHSGVRDQSAVRTRKRQDCRARVLKALAKDIRGDLQRVSRLGDGQTLDGRRQGES
jgi:hypothetical protein